MPRPRKSRNWSRLFNGSCDTTSKAYCCKTYGTVRLPDIAPSMCRAPHPIGENWLKRWMRYSAPVWYSVWCGCLSQSVCVSIFSLHFICTVSEIERERENASKQCVDVWSKLHSMVLCGDIALSPNKHFLLKKSSSSYGFSKNYDMRLVVSELLLRIHTLKFSLYFSFWCVPIIWESVRFELWCLRLVLNELNERTEIFFFFFATHSMRKICAPCQSPLYAKSIYFFSRVKFYCNFFLYGVKIRILV